MNHSTPRRSALRSIRRAARTQPKSAPRRLVHALTACSLLTFWPGAADLRAQVLPTGMSTVAGQASARTVGSTLTVTNSPNAIVNWNSFSIGAANAVRFEQAGATSQVLNRVVGNDPSAILGQLSSNGRVWLLNPNGVLFGPNARVDVAGLVTSTLNLNNADWLAGRALFRQGAGAPAAIVNQGELRSSLGGQIALIGASVRNEGEIHAPGGQVILATGPSVELVDSMTPNVSVKLPAAAGEVVNLGSLVAAGGRIDVHAGTVNQSGIVRADALSSGPAGEIVLQASDRLTLAGTSRTSATGATDKGGRIKLLGREVGLLDSAQVDASGASGGGEVLVGGGQQGKDPSVPNARAVYFGPGASIAADATQAGDGGRIILWGDEATRAFGSLSARGGATGGNGGFIETSGGWLDARPAKVDLSASKGKAGEWLLDPFDITISDAGPDAGYDPLTFTANANSSTISTAVIKSQLDAGSDVTVSTGGAVGTQAGNISVNGANLNVVSSGPGNLTLIADGNILVTGSTISSGFEAFDITLLAGRAGSGGINVLDSNIAGGGGAITLGGFGTGQSPSGSFGSAAFNTAGPGVIITNSTVDAGTCCLGGGGTLTIRGASTGNFPGVSISSNISGPANISGRNAVIFGSTTGNAGGVEFADGTTTTVPGSLNVEGVGNQAGVRLRFGSTITSSSTGGGGIVNLVGATTGGGLNGVRVSGVITASNGNSVSISGGHTAGGTAIGFLDAIVTVNDPAGTLTLSVLNPAVDNDIVITGGPLGGSPGNLVISGANNLILNDVSMPGRRMQFQADHITLNGATSMTSPSPSGDIFVFSGRNGTGPLTSFTNASTVGTGGSGALQTSGSPARWIIWAADITSSSFSPGALPYDFTLYGAASPAAWSAIPDNGYVSAAAGVATVTGTIVPRVYDTTLSVPLQSALQGLGPRGETAVFGPAPTLQYATKTVGTGKQVQLTGTFSATFTDPAGKPAFGLTLQSGMTGDITPATLNLTGLSAANKVYDAGLTTALTGTPSITPIGGDAVSLLGSPIAVFADKNVGTAKPVSVFNVGLTGADNANYVLATPSNLTADITPFQLSLGGVTVSNKVYDATVNATLNGASTANFFGGDAVALSGGTIAFTDKNVGTNKSVQLSGFGLTGADAGNYLAPSATVLTADITPATLNLNGLSAASKVYDSTTTATLTGSPAVTPLGSDTVLLTGTPVGAFVDKNVGTAKAVSVSGVGLSGTDGGNYVLAAPSSLTANITPAPLLVDGYTAANKVYDGTTVATLLGTGSFEPIGSDNVVAVGQPTGTFSSKNVGTRSVTLNGLALGGTDGANYAPVASSSLTGDITPATLAISGVTANNKVYDATAVASLGGSATAAAFGSDVVGVGGTPVATFSNKNVGTGKAVGVSGYTLTGADAANYTAAQPTGLSASITPATLQISGVTAANKVYDGSAAATISGTPSVAALGSDIVTVAGTPSASFSSKDAGTGKTVLISGLSLGGSDAANYQVGGGALVSTADITPATLTYIAMPVSQTAGLAIPPLTGLVSGFVAGETAETATTGSIEFTTSATIASAAGQYAIIGGRLAAANYVFVQDPHNATAMTLNSSQPEVIGAKTTVEAAPQQALQLMARPTPPADPGLGGVVDLVPPPSKGTTSSTESQSSTAATSAATGASTASTPSATALAAPSAFEPVTLSDLSSDALAGMLDARAQYKKVLFADAIAALEKNSALADMPPCRTRADAAAGGCIVTAALKRELQTKSTRADATASAAPAPAATSAAAPAPAAAAAPAAPVAAAPATVFDPSAPPLLAGARRVINASLPQIQRKVALVIGVDRYDDPAIPALANAVGDARAIGKVLESQLGYETVVLENATKKSVVSALNELAVELKAEDSVVLYYAGHGELVEATKLGYWQLSDSDPKRPETWLSNADIGKMVAQLEASQVALISDSCYSGSLVTDQRIRAAVGAVDPAQVLSRKSVVVMSSGGNEPVADAGKQGHSPFAYSLINNFRQLSAWQPGGNVFERVRFAVAKELPQRPQYGAFAAGGYQGGDYLFEQRQLEAGTQ